MKMKLAQTNDLDSLYDDEDSYGGFIPKQKKQKESEVNPRQDKLKQDRSKLREAKRTWEEV